MHTVPEKVVITKNTLFFVYFSHSNQSVKRTVLSFRICVVTFNHVFHKLEKAPRIQVSTLWRVYNKLCESNILWMNWQAHNNMFGKLTNWVPSCLFDIQKPPLGFGTPVLMRMRHGNSNHANIEEGEHTSLYFQSSYPTIIIKGITSVCQLLATRF